MEIIIDLTYDLETNVYDAFFEDLSEDNYLKQYIKEILKSEEVTSDKPFICQLC